MADVANIDAPPVSPGHRTLPLPLPFDPERVGPPPPKPGEENDPYRFGWRYVRRELADGSEVYDQVPLSWEDLLYPEEEDFVVESPTHRRDYNYCHDALETLYRDDGSVVVLGNCRIDFAAAGVRPLGPDVVVLFGVHQWLRQATFEVAVEGGWPVVVIEVSSPSTRSHDRANKPDLYYRAGVEKYVIVDRGWQGTDPPRLIGYQRGPQGWLHLPPDPRGWLDLSPVSVFLGLEGDRAWLYHAATGVRLPDLTGATIAMENAEAKVRDAEEQIRDAEEKIRDEAKARADAEGKVRDEVKARADAEVKARDAEAKARDAEATARDETKARADAEAKARDAEAKTRDAEAKARDAEAKARDEATARLDAEAKARDAEAKARDEATARVSLEERLRELERQLRAKPGQE